MTDYLTKIGVLLVFAAVVAFVNGHATGAIFKLLTFVALLAALGGAGYFVVLVVLS